MVAVSTHLWRVVCAPYVVDSMPSWAILQFGKFNSQRPILTGLGFVCFPMLAVRNFFLRRGGCLAGALRWGRGDAIVIADRHTTAFGPVPRPSFRGIPERVVASKTLGL